MYGDMLSPSTVPPPSTSFLVDYHIAFLVGTILVTVAAVIAAYRLRSIFAVLVIGTLAVVIQMALGVWASSVLMHPLRQLISTIAQ